MTFDNNLFEKLKLTNETSKIFLYSKIKTKYEIDKYISKNSFENRKLLCKMRVSDHFLEIERGRYKRIQRENRICKHCNINAVEDETHFFLKCKINKSLRNQLEKDINNICPEYFNLSETDKLQLILSSFDIMQLTVPFIKKSFALRGVDTTPA